MTLHAAQLLLQKEIFKWPTIPCCLFPHPPMKFVSCVWQHQHTPTQLQKTERISFQKVRIFSFFWVIVFGNFEWGNQGCKKWKKTRPLFICLFCMFFFLKKHFVVIFFPSWLFLFSPPWLEVDDHTCGPNLLKAFNKLLEKTKPSGFYSLKLSTQTVIHEYDWWQSKCETLKLNGDRIYYKPVWLCHAQSLTSPTRDLQRSYKTPFAELLFSLRP